MRWNKKFIFTGLVKRVHHSGQQGHKGRTLKTVSNPDHVVILQTAQCHCTHNLDDVEASKVVKRQSFDLPEIKMVVTQYEQHTKICPGCKCVHTPEFPNSMKATTQYGDNLRSFIAYCNTYQMLPYDRISEMIEDLTEHRLSKGTIYNTLNNYHDKLESYENSIKATNAQIATTQSEANAKASENNAKSYAERAEAVVIPTEATYTYDGI